MPITSKIIDVVTAEEYIDAVEGGADYIAFSLSSPLQSHGSLMWDIQGLPDDPDHPFNVYSRALYESRDFLKGGDHETTRKKPKKPAGARKETLSYDDNSSLSAFTG